MLDLTLGRHPSLVSFGEVARVLLPHCGGGMKSVYDRPCSCGALVRDCEFWGPLTKEIGPRESELDLSARYRIFLDVFAEVFGSSRVPVDSSKFVDAMQSLVPLKNEGLDLKVLFTVRDVRGWASSSRRADKRKREMPYSRLFTKEILRWWRPYLRHNVLRHLPFWLPLEWYIRNSILANFLDNKDLKNCQLSYEKLALDTEDTLKNIFEYIGLSSDARTQLPVSHIVRGNRMAFDQGKINSIKYDAKWLGETWTQYEPMIWPFVMIKNREWVYSTPDDE